VDAMTQRIRGVLAPVVTPFKTYIRAGTCRQAMGIPAYPLASYHLVGAGLYPPWIASCSVMYLPFLVVP
jgi:hypothetical protein